MEHIILSVLDTAMQQYMNPFTSPAVGGAIRSFTDEVNRDQPDNLMHRHPTDYHLYEIGKFNPITGVITPTSPPRLLLRAEDAQLKKE